MSGHHLLFLKKLRHIVIIYRTVGVCVRACVPGGGYMALELFFVSARTNKRHYHACVRVCVCACKCVNSSTHQRESLAPEHLLT